MMGERIKQKRTEYGFTQEELAEKLGLQKSAIAKYENGRVMNIKRDTIGKMASLFNCSPSWLMGFDDNEPAEVAIEATNDALFFKKYTSLSQEQKDIINQVVDQMLQ